MHAWIMFLWLSANPTAITTQEFNTRKECVDTALFLRKEFGKDLGFVCLEKGKK